MDLPAARLGQRAAAAFVATPGRRDCLRRPARRQTASSFYVNEIGLFAMNAGDLATAQGVPVPWPSASSGTPVTRRT